MFNYIMLISLIEKINSINEFLFAPIDNIVEKLPFADWAIDAICDSIHLIPFLFFVFYVFGTPFFVPRAFSTACHF